MRSIHKIKTSAHQRYRRHLRVRKKVQGTPERPRLVVFRSSKHIYAQLVDDQRGVTLAGVADTSEGIAVGGKGKVARSFALGRPLAVVAEGAAAGGAGAASAKGAGSASEKAMASSRT